jgi:uncharacterized Zn-binding protein involved in type VI secretion
MPGFLLHVGAGVQCFHKATATISPGLPKVLVSGQVVATTASQVTVAGCPFQVPVPSGTKPQPCVSIKWGSVATKVLVGGQPALLGPAPGVVPGICQSAERIPQGAPSILTLQARVSAT